jgi:hypothetical protein
LPSGASIPEAKTAGGLEGDDKMIYVILRNGKVLQYNQGETVTVKNGTFCLGQDNGKYLVAHIPIDIVERIEFNKPCRILRAKSKPKRANY